MSTMTTTAADRVARLDELDDDQFKRLIHANLETSNGTKALWTALCHPTMAERTTGCLEEIAEDLEVARAGRPLPPTHAIVRRLAVVGNRIHQVADVQSRWERLAAEAKNAQERSTARDLIRSLSLAINAHRLACIKANLAPEPHDAALWALLDECHLPDERAGSAQPPTLAEMLTAGIWFEPTAGES